MQRHVADLERLERLLERERETRALAQEAAQEAWDELSASLRGFVRDLAETRAFLDNILASSTEYSIIAKDLERRIVMWNEGARRNYGYDAEDVVGRSSDLLHAEEDLQSDMVQRLHAEALSNGVAEGHFMRKRRDGSKFPASVVITRREDADGNPVGYLLISRDISVDLEKRRLEEEARRLENERVVAAEADRLKNEFLANMSHELRTPLNAIIGFADLLLSGRRGPLTPVQQTDLTDVGDNGRHLLALINDVLDLSKVDAGRIAFDPEPVDLEEVARQLTETVRKDIDENDLSIDVQTDQRGEQVVVDPVRLRQIGLNYLSNAVKFSPPGSTVGLRLKVEGPDLVMSVLDHGPGVAPKERHRLFQPFEQLDASMAKRHGGTGLGLALSRRLAEAQEGEAGMTPTQGGGCTFWMRIPRIQTADKGDQHA